MKKILTISYQYRRGVHGDLATASKLIIANHILKKYGFSTGVKASVEYAQNLLTIKKLN